MVKSKLLFVSTWYPANVDRWLSTAFEDYGYEVVRVGKTYFNHYGIEWEQDLLPEVAQELDVNAPLDLPALVSRYEPDILLFWDWNALRLDIHSPCDIIGRGEMLPLKNESLDYIFSCHSLEHIPDTENTLKDWMRVLKQGGIMAVVMPDKRHFTHDHNVTTDGETARNEATPGEILVILKKLHNAKLLLFNTRNNNFDFEFLIKKESII